MTDIPHKNRDHVQRIPSLSLTKKMRWHPMQKAFISRQIALFSPDVIHIHGVFTFVQINAVRAARNARIPVLVSAHGMLEPWLWHKERRVYYWIKRLYWKALIMPTLRNVNYVHAITEQEAETLRHEFGDISQILIPNAIDLYEYDGVQIEPDPVRYLLFIGRLHPKKGVELLIEALHRSLPDDMRLIIAGPNFDAAYAQRLKGMVEELNLSDKVSFVGPVCGDEKDSLLKYAWCTVIPSHSEVVALVNLESAASFTPTITTTMTGLADWQDGGGLLVEPKIEPLSQAIDTVCNWSLVERMEMGKRAREFVEERYSWDTVGRRWVEAYRMIAGINRIDG